MEDKKPGGRLTGSKVSQIANIFQSMVPAKETEVMIANPVPLRNNQREGSPKPERRRTLGGEDAIKEMSPAQVTVVRTESHVARFNNARALFEKLAEDKKPERSIAMNLPSSPDRSPSPSGLSGSVGSMGSVDSVEELDNVVRPRPNGHLNGEHVSMTVTERLAQNRVNGKVNGVNKNEASKRPDLVRKPEKPEKPERKFNSRELIEKQRNWTSHFSKSRSSRYNSDPNKSEVNLTNSSDELKSPDVPTATPAARSASFTSASRVIRSPTCSPPPPPVRDCPPRTFPESPTKPDKSLISPTSHLPQIPARPPPVNNATRPDLQPTSPIRRLDKQPPAKATSPTAKVVMQPVSPTAKVVMQPVSPTAKVVMQPVSPTAKVITQPVSPTAKVIMQPVSPTAKVIMQPVSPTAKVITQPVSPTGKVIVRPISPITKNVAPPSPQHDERQDEKSTDSSTSTTSNSDSILLSPGRNSDLMNDSDKRLREEEFGEVRQDVAHVDKRKKVVSCVNVRLQAAGLGPTRPTTVRSSSHLDNPEDRVEQTPIVNSVLRDLDASHDEILPAARYTEITNQNFCDNYEANSNSQYREVDLISDSGYSVLRSSVEPPKVPSPELVEEIKELSTESILDLHDVEYADADGEENSDSDSDGGVYQVQEVMVKSFAEVKPDIPDTMTPDEAENLLSSKILEKKKRQEGLLSDEEAQEVVRLLSPTEEQEREEKDDPEWLAEVLSASSNSLLNESTLHDSTLDGRSRSEISVTMEDSMTSSRIGSQSGSDLLGSVSSLTDQEGGDDYYPEPGKIVIVENGVHYYEDGHFWMEVPGIPDPEEDEDAHLDITVKQNMKVKFSTGPIKVFSTFSVNDYDRRNDDVDPVAASAEYELEKRVEKMDVFPVELIKGPEGLGLSIIGMGVGADAGLEKLGIFVKTITENGAAAKDERIQVNDQIIEVDAKSLVGVTQAYAASVLRNTCGLVKFLIGRERDTKNSEVALLIKQSLQADKERDEHRRQMEQQQHTPPRTTSRGFHHLADPSGTHSPEGQRSEDSSTTLPLTGTSPTTSSSSEAPLSPPGATDQVFEMEPSGSSNDLDSIRRLLVETRFKLNLADGDIARLKTRLTEMEGVAPDNEEFIERLRQSSLRLRETERNFYAAKKDVASYQDMIEQSQGQYLALEKKYCKAKKLLKEFQQREQDMVHREEFYLQLIQENDMEYNALVKSLKDRVIALEHELLQTQRTAGLPTVLPYDSTNLRQLTPQLSRKQHPPPVKPLHLEDELSDTEISDISPDDGDKTATVERKMPVKEELDRAVPPHELLDVSASKAKGELGTRGGLAGRQLPTNKKTGPMPTSNSDYGLESSMENSADEEEQDRRQQLFIDYNGQEDTIVSPNRPTTLTSSSHVHNLVAQFATAQQISSQPIMIPKSHPHHFPPVSGQALYAHATHSNPSQSLHLHSHHPHQQGTVGPPPSLAEQLKQVLAERERRISGGECSSREGSGDFTDINKGISQTLVEEIRQAVNEANARVKKVPLSQCLVPPGSQQPWLPQSSPMRDIGPPSPSSMSSGSISPGASLDPSPSRLGDSGDIWTTPDPEKKASHIWQSVPVNDWSKEQVCQWLMALSLEQHIPKFLELQIGGSSLLQLESRDFKQLGINGEDKNRLKRKLKDLKARVEKEKRQQEKERKYKEQLQRKAEKLAFKASKQK